MSIEGATLEQTYALPKTVNQKLSRISSDSSRWSLGNKNKGSVKLL